jgi:hypothetical protein
MMTNNVGNHLHTVLHAKEDFNILTETKASSVHCTIFPTFRVKILGARGTVPASHSCHSWQRA